MFLLCENCEKLNFSYTSVQAGTSQAEGRQVKVCLKIGWVSMGWMSCSGYQRSPGPG